MYVEHLNSHSPMLYVIQHQQTLRFSLMMNEFDDDDDVDGDDERKVVAGLVEWGVVVVVLENDNCLTGTEDQYYQKVVMSMY